MRKNLFYGVFAALTLGLAACSSDDLVSITDQKVEHDQTQYIAVQISAPRDAVTRADGDFENGTTNESYISRLDFFFYDAAGNPTSTPLTMLEAEMKSGGKYEGTFTENSSGNNVTRIFTTVVPAALTQGQNLPSQIICIVNGVTDNINLLKTKTLDELIDVTRESYRNGNNFIMSNSVYYGTNVLTGQANQRLCATPININSQLFGTADAAKNAITNGDGTAIVDIYVERLAAKVGLIMGANTVSAYELQNGDAGTGTVSLTFTPEYWAMNATDKNVYLTKRYGVENTDGTTNLTPTYDQIYNALTQGGNWPVLSWNSEANHRSYWGASPSYFANNYPDVSDDVNDLDNAETSQTNGSYNCNYYTYNQVAAQVGRTTADAGTYGIGKQALAAGENGIFAITNDGTNATGYIYTRETTVAKQRINNIATGNPAAAVASAVLVGKYKVTGAEGNATTFYVDRNVGEGGTYYAVEANAKNTLINRQAILFTDDNATTAVTNPNTFTLMHPSYAVRTKAGTKLAGRLVTIQLASVPSPAVYYYDINKDNGEGNDKGGYVAVDEKNLVDVNAQLLSVGYMDMFANGLAFYSIPIRHLNWNDDWYTTNANGGGTYNWAAMQSGSLGVVRNHVYNLKISSIKGLGTALRSPDQPIVPAKEEANQYIAARLNVLAWHIAKSWTVDL